MRPLFFVKDTVEDVACEQALCLGKKKSRGEGRERGNFPSPQFPARLKACSQTTEDVI